MIYTNGSPSSVVLLSDKSSGSTILQKVLGQHSNISRICEKENNYESKYWAYSTAILGLSQPIMKYSHEFPIGKAKAVKSINSLFRISSVPTLHLCDAETSYNITS